MKSIKTIPLFLLIVFLLSCGNSRVREFHSYRQSPKFIKEFITDLHQGRFLIAERGERWESGCVLNEGEKNCQFISAFIDSVQYRLNFWGGGYAGKHKEELVINFKGDKVISYAFKNSSVGFIQVDANK